MSALWHFSFNMSEVSTENPIANGICDNSKVLSLLGAVDEYVIQSCVAERYLCVD